MTPKQSSSRPSSAARPKSPFANPNGVQCASKKRSGSAHARPGQRSAQHLPTSQPPSRSLTRASSADPGRNVTSLQALSRDLKCAAHAAGEENMRTRTRLMALDRELQKRDRLLHSMMQLRNSGMGLGIDMIDKLREERNMLPIYRRKAQEIQSQIEERDEEIKRMKRDPHFTRIIELQVEYASWQHETRRLESLLLEPSGDSNETAQKEVEINLSRVEKLQAQLSKAEKRRAEVDEELEEMEADHAASEAAYKDQERELLKEQDLTRDLAVTFKQLLQERRDAEKLQDEIDELGLQCSSHQQELQAIRTQLKTLKELAAKRESMASAPPALVISGTALYTELPAPSGPSSESLRCIRRAGLRPPKGSEASRTLFACLQLQDQDEDGLLSHQELLEALSRWLFCPVDPQDAAHQLLELLESCSSEEAETARWLDVLTVLDCLGRSGTSAPSDAMPSRPPLPDLTSLRVACLRKNLCGAKFQEKLLAAESLSQAEGLFGTKGLLELPAPSAAEWLRIWQSHGSQSLLLQLPLTEVSATADSISAWRARCEDAVRAHRKELVESFTVWRADMLLTKDQFKMVCFDVLGTKLSEDDVLDLGLLAGQESRSGGAETIDGHTVLELAD
eukprot:TRINITY_DN16817_c0_g2_i1.p1 TRINITY_DN16817_c0_g2~~TRINITY_DN16817_c0_g2_i1.p1  ORF type:complete len:623 (-),score=138.14 TRINITY_DN16817_c0_g2_i1:267-2135(-)